MDDLGYELRRLGMGSSRANGQMLKAEREAFQYPRPAPIARAVRVTRTYAQEQSLTEVLGMIATAFRKGELTEDQAKALVSKLGR